METDFDSGFAKATYGITHTELELMGERAVRDAVNTGKYGSIDNKIHAYVSAWIKDQEFTRLEKREAENLSISRKALSNSQLATRIAFFAIVLSLIMAIQKIIEWSSK